MGRDVIINGIGEVTDLLYQQKIPEGYSRLNSLIQDLSVYITTIQRFSQIYCSMN